MDALHRQPIHPNHPRLLDHLNNYIAIDCETTGLNRHKPFPGFSSPAFPFMVSTCDHAGITNLFYGQVDPTTRHVRWYAKEINALRRLLKKYSIAVLHNSRFDIWMLEQIGINLPDLFGWANIHDTLPLSHVLDSRSSHALNDLAYVHHDLSDYDAKNLQAATVVARREARKLDIPTAPEPKADYWLPAYLSENYDIETDDDSGCDNYAERDAVRTSVLASSLSRNLPPENWPHYQREQRLLPIIDKMERNGIHIRKIVMCRELKRLARNLNQSLTEIRALTDSEFNPRSYKQLSNAIYSKFGLPVITNKDGNPTTDRDAIETLSAATEVAHHRRSTRRTSQLQTFFTNLLTYRENNTAAQYLEGYLEREFCNYLFPSYNANGTDSTRFSGRDPNPQNISKSAAVPLRHCFGPPIDHFWISIDFNQLELRLMAKASGDLTLTTLLAEGGDQHQITADGFNIPRKTGKNINFAWQYGAGANKLSMMAGVSAAEFNETMTTLYPDVVSFMATSSAIARQQGFIRTLYGYPLRVPHDSPYKACNYTIQGTAGDVAKNAMIFADDYIACNRLENKVRLVLNVHDELVFECHKSLTPSHISGLAYAMEMAGDLIDCPTPVSVDIHQTHWGRGRDFDHTTRKRPACLKTFPLPL